MLELVIEILEVVGNVSKKGFRKKAGLDKKEV